MCTRLLKDKLRPIFQYISFIFFFKGTAAEYYYLSFYWYSRPNALFYLPNQHTHSVKNSEIRENKFDKNKTSSNGTACLVYMETNLVFIKIFT